MTRIIESYVHGGRIGVLIEVECLDDATVKTEQFRYLLKSLAMHVAASNPSVVAPRPSADVLPFRFGLESNNTEKAGEDRDALLSQSFVKDPSKTVAEVIADAEAELAARIQVIRFVRHEAGETQPWRGADGEKHRSASR